MKYLVFLGRKSEIAACELSALLHRLRVSCTNTEVAPSVQLLEGDSIDAALLQKLSGGVVKIAEVIEERSNQEITQEDVLSFLVHQAEQSEKKKIQFSLYEHGKRQLDTDIFPWLKKELVKLGISSRYLESDHNGLSAAYLTHKSITELVFVYTQTGVLIAVTKTAQDIDAWSMVDYDKPYRDAKKGMLPPKLARMMINIALEDISTEQPLVYDPFCGSGTVLMEANTLKIEACGSDLDKEAVKGAERNVNWLKTIYHDNAQSSIFLEDATHVSIHQLPRKVDCIVTEPFLGRTNPREKDADNILRGLSKMYIGMFKVWRQILNKNATVVCVFPELAFEHSVKNMENIIDTIESLGYTREKGPLMYDRPQTIVKRAIYRFRYR